MSAIVSTIDARTTSVSPFLFGNRFHYRSDIPFVIISSDGDSFILPASKEKKSVFMDFIPQSLAFYSQYDNRLIRFLPDDKIEKDGADIYVSGDGNNSAGYVLNYRFIVEKGRFPEFGLFSESGGKSRILFETPSGNFIEKELGGRAGEIIWHPDISFNEEGEYILQWRNQEDLSIISLSGLPFLDVYPADASAILDKSEEIPDASYLAFRMSFDSRIHCLFFSDYATQALYLKRLAFFIEKPGYRGSLLSDEELIGKHGWNAHDYSSDSLARFFNKADQDGFVLNTREEELRRYCLSQGIISEEEGSYRGENQSLVSLAAESEPYLRHLLLTHETVHGIYFVSEDFRREIDRLWGKYEELHRLWELFLRRNDYDTGDSVLVVNEWTAYLLQQPVVNLKDYLLRRFNRIKAIHPEDSDIIDSELPKALDLFEEAAFEIEALINERYGIHAGDFSLISEVIISNRNKD